jgi:hypothetical protein
VVNRSAEAFGRQGRAAAGRSKRRHRGCGRGMGNCPPSPRRFHLQVPAQRVFCGLRLPPNENLYSIAAGRDLLAGNDALVTPAPRRPALSVRAPKRRPIAIRAWEVGLRPYRGGCPSLSRAIARTRTDLRKTRASPAETEFRVCEADPLFRGPLWVCHVSEPFGGLTPPPQASRPPDAAA